MLLKFKVDHSSKYAYSPLCLDVQSLSWAGPWPWWWQSYFEWCWRTQPAGTVNILLVSIPSRGWFWKYISDTIFMWSMEILTALVETSILYHTDADRRKSRDPVHCCSKPRKMELLVWSSHAAPYLTRPGPLFPYGTWQPSWVGKYDFLAFISKCIIEKTIFSTAEIDHKIVDNINHKLENTVVFFIFILDKVNCGY